MKTMTELLEVPHMLVFELPRSLTYGEVDDAYREFDKSMHGSRFVVVEYYFGGSEKDVDGGDLNCWLPSSVRRLGKEFAD